MFTALDLVSIQTQTRVQGKVRRNKSLTEINHYEAEHDEINVQDVYQWQAETDEYLKMGTRNTLEEIQFDRGWSNEKLQEELFKREVILAYLIKKGLNTYAEVAATVQAFINDPDDPHPHRERPARGQSRGSPREMESVLIDVDPEKRSSSRVRTRAARRTTSRWTSSSGPKSPYSRSIGGRSRAASRAPLGDVEEESTIDVDRADSEEFDFAGEVDETVDEDEWELGAGSSSFAAEDDDDGDEPAWLSEETGFAIGGDSDSDEATARARPTLLPQPMRVRRTVGPTPAVVRPRSSRHPLSMKLRTLPPRAAVHSPDCAGY